MLSGEKFKQLNLVDYECLGLYVDIAALACYVVGTLTCYLASRESRRYLLYGSLELRENRLDELARDVLHRIAGVDFGFEVK